MHSLSKRNKFVDILFVDAFLVFCDTFSRTTVFVAVPHDVVKIIVFSYKSKSHNDKYISMTGLDNKFGKIWVASHFQSFHQGDLLEND